MMSFGFVIFSLKYFNPIAGGKALLLIFIVEYARQSLAFSYDEGKAFAKPMNANLRPTEYLYYSPKYVITAKITELGVLS